MMLIFVMLIVFTAASYKYKYQLDLAYPDIVTDEFGDSGFWTLIYNQVRLLSLFAVVKIVFLNIYQN